MFIPTGISETLNKETEIGQLLRFKELSVQDPTVNRAEINKRIAELMRFKDIQKLLTPEGPGREPGGLDPNTQQMIRQRLAEGATPEQIKAELLGTPPQIEPGQHRAGRLAGSRIAGYGRGSAGTKGSERMVEVKYTTKEMV